MKIPCPNCGTRFSVPDRALGQTGRTLKCARCGHKWHQHPAPGTETPPPTPATDAAPPAEPPPGDHGPLSEHLGMAPPPPVDEAEDDVPPMTSEPPEGRGRDVWPDGSGRDAAGSAADDSDDFDFDDILARLESQEKERTGRSDRTSDDRDTFGDDDLPGVLRGRLGDQARGRRRPPAWASWLMVGVVVVAGALGGLYFLRDTVVGVVPAAEPVYTALGIPLTRPGLGLEFENVVPTREMVDDDEILVVRGFINNISEVERPVPGLRLTLNDEAGAMVQQMTAPPPVDALPPGETAPFRITLRNRLPDAVQIEVAFTERPADPMMAPPAQ
ncbi:DUF3426 domain-containing protein [Roseospira navarrensis]|uniref:DUF3426 domain-containing protein n=1 Tax=Roseospira navarrensis TaxID=140058 RepID=A0A7X2D3N7_9PROT|nr:DUF3426 domain-containing protein [Roseospira navarrensis]MQX35812.1 DUF3426 domain-containing protein [Roseospira navarrensis]